MLPPRCFTCGKVIGNMWDKYVRLIAKWRINHQLIALVASLREFSLIGLIEDEILEKGMDEQDVWLNSTWQYIVNEENYFVEMNVSKQSLIDSYNYELKKHKGKECEKSMDDLGLERICCRRMVFTHLPTIDLRMDYDDFTQYLPVNDTSRSVIQKFNH